MWGSHRVDSGTLGRRRMEAELSGPQHRAGTPWLGAGCHLGSSFVKRVVLGAGAAEPQVGDTEREERGAEGETGAEDPVSLRGTTRPSCFRGPGGASALCRPTGGPRLADPVGAEPSAAWHAAWRPAAAGQALLGSVPSRGLSWTGRWVAVGETGSRLMSRVGPGGLEEGAGRATRGCPAAPSGRQACGFLALRIGPRKASVRQRSAVSADSCEAAGGEREPRPSGWFSPSFISRGFRFLPFAASSPFAFGRGFSRRDSQPEPG